MFYSFIFNNTWMFALPLEEFCYRSNCNYAHLNSLDFVCYCFIYSTRLFQMGLKSFKMECWDIIFF